MFNRAIQVKMVKNEKEEAIASDHTDHHFEGKTAIIGEHLRHMIGTVGKLILLYIAADTIRQVSIEKAKK